MHRLKEYPQNHINVDSLNTIWRRSSIIWMIIDYVINILAFFASILIIYIEASYPQSNTLPVIVLSAIAATLTFVCFAINPKQHMRKYRKAYETLNAALLQQNYDGTEKDVLTAIIKGEQLINNTYDVD